MSLYFLLVLSFSLSFGRPAGDHSLIKNSYGKFSFLFRLDLSVKRCQNAQPSTCSLKFAMFSSKNKAGGGHSLVVWNFSKNSSVLEKWSFPKSSLIKNMWDSFTTIDDGTFPPTCPEFTSPIILHGFETKREHQQFVWIYICQWCFHWLLIG